LRPRLPPSDREVFQARAANEQGLVAEVRRHASEAHGMALTHEEALLLAFRAERDDSTLG